MRRPVLIEQDDLLTDSRPAAVMVVPLTFGLKLEQAQGNVLLKASESGLGQPSVAWSAESSPSTRTFQPSWWAASVAAPWRRWMLV